MSDCEERINALKIDLINLVSDVIMESTDIEVKTNIATAIAEYLERRDNRLLACDGPARDTLEGCEMALRDVYLIATGKPPVNEI